MLRLTFPTSRATMIRTVIRLLAPVVGLLAGSALAQAQVSTADLLLRIDQLETQVRHLTGSIEQLQYRNQQLEQSLRRVQEDAEIRFQELGGKSAARGAVRPAPSQPAPVAQAPQPAPQAQYQPPHQAPYQQAPQAQQPQTQVAAAGGRRADVFDPSQNPSAPGAPRVLGSMASAAPEPPAASEAPMGGRPAGSPLDLSTLAANANGPAVAPAGQDGGMLPPPPPRNPNATGARVATQTPTGTPRDEYDLAYGYIQRKDYGPAEQGFRAFLTRYPNDRMAPDAQYWLGESLFQRQNYRDAADAFLNMSKKYEANPKSAEALLRLGQSLAALHEKELACETFGEITRKYPRASTSIRQAIEREQKRVRC
jgi:tol-pal system protein YbgF